jgi:hypothetical protein
MVRASTSCLAIPRVVQVKGADGIQSSPIHAFHEILNGIITRLV